MITGASRGFGKLWAKAFLKNGDKVVATARNLNDLDDLVNEFGDAVLPVRLDVTNRSDCFTAVAHANTHFARLDVVINNAGFGLFGAVEEVNEAALDHIHIVLVDEANNLLLSTYKTISETAYHLGFENPPYFSRLFKKAVGLTPGEFKEQHIH